MQHVLEQCLEAARSIAGEVVEPNAERWDREASWPSEALAALKSAGLAGLVVPTDRGGHGLGLEALLRVCETLGHADASVGLCFGMHGVATACIAAKDSDSSGAELLGSIAAGEHLTTLALSEPGSGSHFYIPSAELRPDEDGYRVSGTKSFVTNGGHADSYVVSTADADGDVGQFSMVLVEAGAAGITWGDPWRGWGMRANSSQTMVLDNVAVPRNRLLGAEGDQIWYVFQVVAPYFLVAMAGTYLGLASRALDEVTEHMRQRRHSHSGSALAEITVLQHRLGTLYSSLQRTRQLCYWAAAEGDRGTDSALAALCSAKAEVAHAAVDIVNGAMTLTGGRGYAAGGRLTRLLRDARAAHVMSPTTDILYTWAGRAILGLPLLGE